MRELTHDSFVRLAGERVPYRLRRRARRRHMHLHVDEEGVVEVRGPWRTAPEEAERLIGEHAQWVIDALARSRARRRARPVLRSGAVLPFAGERLVLALDIEAQLELPFGRPLNEQRPPTAARVRLPAAGALARRGPAPERWMTAPEGCARRRGDVLEVRAPSLEPEAVRPIVVAWYRRAAKRYLRLRLREVGAAAGLQPAGVAVRAQRTLWGSCTSKGVINLNWKLVLLPEELSDYVMVHELCHLEHLNHSRRFWTAVAAIEPNYRALEARLDGAQDSLPL